MTRTRRAGFTLVDTIAAIVILAVAVPPMLWAVTESQRQRINPMMVSKARWLAVERIEDVIADRHSTDGGLGWGNLATVNYPAETPIAGFANFNRTVTIPAEHGAWDNVGQTWLVPAGGYKTITVAVDWTDAGGDARTLSISTVLTDYP